MSRKVRAGRPWTPLQPTALNPAQARYMDSRDRPAAAWQNDRYLVLVFERENGVTELSIRRQDRDYPRDWRHFQRIKNEILGPEREACELFPAESRLVDGANQFHLWALPAGERFPFGYNDGRSVMDANDPRGTGIGGRQRPLEET